VLSNFTHTKKEGGFKGLHDRVGRPGTVDAGIIDAGKHEDSDLTIAEIGFENEFGTDIIPERSFIRSTVQGKKRNIIELRKKLFKKILKGYIEIDKALALLGELLSDEIRKKIVAIREPPNAPRTLEEKYPKTNPLINTSQLKNSITYKVNR